MRWSRITGVPRRGSHRDRSSAVRLSSLLCSCRLRAYLALVALLPGVVILSGSRILANDLAARGRPETNMDRFNHRVAREHRREPSIDSALSYRRRGVGLDNCLQFARYNDAGCVCSHC